MHFGRPVGVHVGESLVAEGAAGGADRPEVFQCMGFDGTESGGGHRVDELGRHPQEGEVALVGQVEEATAVGLEG